MADLGATSRSQMIARSEPHAGEFCPRRVLRMIPQMARTLFLLMVLALSCGCRSVERTMFGLSRIRSPVSVDLLPMNAPMTTNDLARLSATDSTGQRPPPAPGLTRFDDFADWTDRDRTLVCVCISGGGSRAARMAAHVMAALEAEYNTHNLATSQSKPALIQQFDFWSSVSGGSLYASWVAEALHRHPPGLIYRSLAPASLKRRIGPSEGERAFERLQNGLKPQWAMQRLGALAAASYFSPLNLGYAPLMLLLTEWDTLDLFARTHAMYQNGSHTLWPLQRLQKLGSLTTSPRFFFNATCLETRRPFVFTQSAIHPPALGDPLLRHDCQLDPLLDWEQWAREADRSLPLGFAATLEDVGSSPAAFPLAHAAMASGASPGFFMPLQLAKFVRDRPGNLRRQGFVTLVDGGVYDNTGITTALTLFGHLRHKAKASGRQLRLLMLLIDADNEQDQYAGPRNRLVLPLRLVSPLRGMVSGISTVSQLYIKQKAMVHRVLVDQLTQLRNERCLEWFDVELTDATAEPFGVSKIPSDFVISPEEDSNLRQAVDALLAKPGPRKGRSVKEGFLDALTEAKGVAGAAQPVGDRAPK